MPIERFIWGSGLSEHAWQHAESTGAAWVGNDASAQISLLRSTVAEELAVGMEQRGVARHVMREQVDAALAYWGLTHIANQDPMRLSTGQTRRVAIASALLARPDALVLDCPLDGLDEPAAHHLACVLEAFPGPVTVYGRTASVLSDATPNHFQLTNDEQLVPQVAPRVDVAALVADPATAPAPGRAGADTRADVGDAMVPGAGADTGDAVGTEHAGGEPVLEFRDVRVRSLGPFSFDLCAGEITHLSGDNGSGKTSLMLAALGLVDYSGEIRAGGTAQPGAHEPARAVTLGWAPTAMDQSFLRRTVLLDVAAVATEDEAKAVLTELDLMRWADTHPLDVPSSDRRLVLVAAAMVRRPEVLLIDEPTVGLDVEGQRRLIAAMRAYVSGVDGVASRRTNHITPPAVLWTCHDEHLANAVSDRTLRIGRRRV